MKVRINLINQKIITQGVPVKYFKSGDDYIEIVLDEERIAKEYSNRIRNSIASLNDSQLRKLRENPKTPDKVHSMKSEEMEDKQELKEEEGIYYPSNYKKLIMLALKDFDRSMKYSIEHPYKGIIRERAMDNRIIIEICGGGILLRKHIYYTKQHSPTEKDFEDAYKEVLQQLLLSGIAALVTLTQKRYYENNKE